MHDADDAVVPQDGAVSVVEYCEIIEAGGRRRVRFGTSLTIGRHPTNGLCLDEPLISSFHAAIEWSEDGWSARDLGSLNGTSLNGRRLNGRTALREGDVLRFARSGAWCVERLVPDPRRLACPSLERTQGVQRSLPSDLRIEIMSIGPTEGVVTARWGGDVQQQTLGGTPFLLLDRLGQAPGDWITDAELRRDLWGRRWDSLCRSALHTPIYTLRRVFESWGIAGAIIEKEQGATRLCLGPGQVARVGQRDGVGLCQGPDGEE